MFNWSIILVLVSKYVVIHIKMLLSLKMSGHHGYAVAFKLKVSHLLSIQCSIQVLSMSWYPKELLFIYTVIHKDTRAWWAFLSFRVESQSLSKHKSYDISIISWKTSGHDGHSVASWLKVSHFVSKHCLNNKKHSENPKHLEEKHLSLVTAQY